MNRQKNNREHNNKLNECYFDLLRDGSVIRSFKRSITLSILFSSLTASHFSNSTPVSCKYTET